MTTGTTRSGEISSDVKLAAQSTATAVILMAMSKLEQIMDLFIQYGKKETPSPLYKMEHYQKKK